jgi:two-component system nitrate/nitrite response regulator NarL
VSTPAPARYGQPLTGRELQVVCGVANGRSNAEIASELFLTENTVKSHLQRAGQKLGATGRAHTVGLAIATQQLSTRAINTPVFRSVE